MGYRVIPVFKISAQQVGKNKTPAFPHSNPDICRRAAGIYSNLSGKNRLKRLLAFAHGVEQSQFSHVSCIEEVCAQVSLPSIRKYYYNRALGHSFGFVSGNNHGCAAAHACKNAFLSCKTSRHFKGIFVINILFLVE